MSEEIERRVSELYVRIFDAPDTQAYIAIETREAKHLVQYAYEKFLEAKRAKTEMTTLRDQFIKHRAATHEVAPSFCKTCRESDAVLYG